MPNQEPPTPLSELIGLLSRQLNIRLTFFDCTGTEQAVATGRPHSDFCLRHRREDPEFDARCVRCDLEHLAEARRTRREVIYCCHAGLLDGVVPLYSRRGLYLGGLVFGLAQAFGGANLVAAMLFDTRDAVREKAKEAMLAAGVTPRVQAIRGGTDGAQLSFKGLPCPNIFAGGLNFHGRFEFVPIQSMEKARDVIVKIAELTALR